ncbi:MULTISPECIES: helix-turn-helix transcriptional regulator [Sphingomonas]|uniref:helix-turn-helix transcriptional regulator n=1 Tax=Sphingomonas TaxID=13687 RepID=UPI000A738D89|nr:AlpA family phage regulatory protein [Sphingomonas sp. CCH10-B3]
MIGAQSLTVPVIPIEYASMSHHGPIASDQAQPSGRFLSMVDVEHAISLSKATINRLHRIGRFPRKRHLSDRRIGWFESDIAAWQATRRTAGRVTTEE